MGFEVDIRFTWPSGGKYRGRCRAPVSTRTQALAWGRAREAELLAQGPGGALAHGPRKQPQEKEVPTVLEFWPRFITDHCKANRQKPSGIERKESAFRVWLAPRLGSKRLDEIGPEDIAALKGELREVSPKSANNVLTALSACLKFAGPEGLKRSDGLGIIAKVPRVKLLHADNGGEPGWYEPHEYRALVEAAATIDPRAHLLVLLGGSAGLRRGEMMALRWTDIDLKRATMTVARSIWRQGGAEDTAHETETKGGKTRRVGLTQELVRALTKHRNLRDRVLTADDGRPLTNKLVRVFFERTQRKAGVEVTGAVHRLRHTFCSSLAARGATVTEIKALAGHASISTTQRYMHVAPSNLRGAIALLEPQAGEQPGNSAPEFANNREN